MKTRVETSPLARKNQQIKQIRVLTPINPSAVKKNEQLRIGEEDDMANY